MELSEKTGAGFRLIRSGEKKALVRIVPLALSPCQPVFLNGFMNLGSHDRHLYFFSFLFFVFLFFPSSSRWVLRQYLPCSA